MRIDAITTFPNSFDSYMNSSIMKRAQDKDLLQFYSHNLRDFTNDLHKTTDDKPYGGGCGQLMMCDPIFKCLEYVKDLCDDNPKTIFLSPCGKQLNDREVDVLLKEKHLVFVCGHYEGIDERAYSLADYVYSVGDFVLSSGELASMVIIDAVVRKIPGVLNRDESFLDESFADGLLEPAQYTRPYEYDGKKVPDVLLSGNHQKIAE